jgi:hypothetical protein
MIGLYVASLEAPGDVFAAAQALPELGIGIGRGFFRRAEHPVRLAFQLGHLIAHALEKQVVGGHYSAIQGEFDHGRGTQQALDQVFILARGFDGAGQVAGIQHDLFQAAFFIVEGHHHGP